MTGRTPRMTEQELAAYLQRQRAADARGNQIRTTIEQGEMCHLEVPQELKPAAVGKPRKRPEYREDAKQRSLIDWSQHVSVGAWRLSELLFAIPNGGYRTSFEAVNFKLLGVQAGFPDLGLPVPAASWHGGYWEMKHGKNTPTATQQRWHATLRELGYYVATCWEWEQAARDIVQYLRQSDYQIIERVSL